MARRPKILTALDPIALGAAAALLFAFTSPGMTRSSGTGVVIPFGDLEWP